MNNFEPKYDYRKLRGLIREVFRTEGAFAEALNRSQNYLSKVFKGESYFSQKDIDLGSELLGILPHEIGTYFFAK